MVIAVAQGPMSFIFMGPKIPCGVPACLTIMSAGEQHVAILILLVMHRNHEANVNLAARLEIVWLH